MELSVYELLGMAEGAIHKVRQACTDSEGVLYLQMGVQHEIRTPQTFQPFSTVFSQKVWEDVGG